MPQIILFWYIAARTSWAATMQQKLGSMFHKHDLILTTMLPSWMLDIHYYTWATSPKAASHLKGENHLTPKPIPVCVPQTSGPATLLFLLKHILHLLALVMFLMPLNPSRLHYCPRLSTVSKTECKGLNKSWEKKKKKTKNRRENYITGLLVFILLPTSFPDGHFLNFYPHCC